MIKSMAIDELDSQAKRLGWKGWADPEFCGEQTRDQGSTSRFVNEQTGQTLIVNEATGRVAQVFTSIQRAPNKNTEGRKMTAHFEFRLNFDELVEKTSADVVALKKDLKARFGPIVDKGAMVVALDGVRDPLSQGETVPIGRAIAHGMGKAQYDLSIELMGGDYVVNYEKTSKGTSDGTIKPHYELVIRLGELEGKVDHKELVEQIKSAFLPELSVTATLTAMDDLNVEGVYPVGQAIGHKFEQPMRFNLSVIATDPELAGVEGASKYSLAVVPYTKPAKVVKEKPAKVVKEKVVKVQVALAKGQVEKKPVKPIKLARGQKQHDLQQSLSKHAAFETVGGDN